MSQPHEKLVAWLRADDLCVEIYRFTKDRLPPSERYELASQLRRAAYSVAANLVEGFASESPATRLRYSKIAVGSLAEVGYGIHLAQRLGYVKAETSDALVRHVSQTAAPLHGLIKHLRRERASQKRG